VRVHREDPAEAVAEQVQAWGVELVVLASGGRTGWAKWFLPSVAQAIARSAGVATLLLRPGTPWPDPPRLRRILVPVDHDPRPEPALSEAARFARALGAEDGEIRLLYAGPVLDAPRVRPPAVPGWSWTEVVSDAPPVEAILSAAAAADLVVMASAGRRGLGDHLWGSTVERVFERCPCPLVRAVG
jgi:nucleotide-binding universal stress UspA family protein